MAAQTLEKQPLGALGRIGIVVGMHAALLLVLARGFGIVPSLELPPTLTGEFIDNPDPVETPPPLPQVVPIPAQSLAIPMPEIDVPIDIGSTEGAITAELRSVEEITAGSALPVPQVIAPRADPRHPLTQPPYPMTDIREGNEGFVDLEIYVMPNGRVGDARVFRSSGFARLDQSAVEEARKRWRLLPATRDGEPVAQWHRLRVKFELKNR